jgi:hypothetical protein
MEIINLNLIPTGTRPVVHASQYDNGRQFRANLFEGASVYTLTGAETLTFSVRKPDGHIVTEAVTNTSDNYVVIETTTQMCACAGDSFAELKIENGDDLIGTLNLILAVEQSPEEGGDPSESFIHNLEQQIADAVADQYDADNVVFDATPTAGHGVGFAVTSEGILNAIPDELDDLSDVTTSAPTSGEALVWDGTKWTNGTPTLDVDDLNDVTITTPTDGDILVYNNGTWENQANPSSTQNFAPDYDDTQTYNTNDKVIYQGLLYICNDDNVTGTWDATKWDAFTVADISGDSIPMSPSDPDFVADRITALETSVSGKADKTALTLNVNNVLDSLTTDLRVIVGTIQMSFSGGTATSSISAFLPNNYSFTSIAFACAKSTGSLDITGAEVSSNNLTVRSTQTGVVTVDINFLAFARKN